jgi:acyl-CoA thioesterase
VAAKLRALLETMSPEEQQEALYLVEKLKRAPQSRVGFLAHLIGLRWHAAGRGHVRCELPVTTKLFNPQGVLHGGVVFTMVDYSMGAATVGLLNPTKGERCATVEVKINYLSAVTGGKLIADTSVVSEGTRIVVLESRVTNEDGRLVALATGSYFIIR